MSQVICRHPLWWAGRAFSACVDAAAPRSLSTSEVSSSPPGWASEQSHGVRSADGVERARRCPGVVPVPAHAVLEGFCSPHVCMFRGPVSPAMAAGVLPFQSVLTLPAGSRAPR